MSFGDAASSMAQREVDVASSEIALLGESPRWDHRVGELAWLDVRKSRAWFLEPLSGAVRSVELGYTLTALGLRSGGGWVAADKTGFVVFDDLGATAVTAYLVESKVAVAYMNDGNVDPDGSFWAGSSSAQRGARAGSLYRLSPDGQVNRLLTGLEMSNGIAWSPQGDELYFVDTGTGGLDALTLTPRGGFGARRCLVTIPPEIGLPDGITVDIDGGIWVAIWGAGAVHRYTPSGKLDMVVSVPASRTTACAFGGDDLSTLFITTAVRGSPRDRAPLDPLGGRLFACRPGTAGLAANVFGPTRGGQ